MKHDCHTINTDEGLGVLKWKSEPDVDFLSEIISNPIKYLPYSFLEKNRISSLGLQNSVELS